jgi:hypothetical protein
MPEFDISTPRGQETINHSSPAGVTEVAIRPAPFPGHPEIYSSKDVDKEKELAAIDFYAGQTSDGADIVPIPKTYSTSPGLNIHAVHLPAGMSRLSYADRHASKSRAPGDEVIAKFKQTVPTHFTYSPSILGYYHLSRFLSLGHVEPAIIRTMDVAAHKSLADLGKEHSQGSNNRNQWTQLRALDDSHSNGLLYTKDGKQIYGALQANPGGEESYPHLSQLGGVGAFAASSEFGRVSNAAPLKTTCMDANGKLIQSAVQQVIQIQDLADMILLDFIMAQADRFSGNMHCRQIYVWIENGELKKDVKKSNSAKAAQQLTTLPPEAVLVNQMIMKDNDAGLISGNSAKSAHLLDKIGHMDSNTYNALLELQQELQKPEVSQWFETELLFTPNDFKTIKDNTDLAVSILSPRIDKTLFLDANLEHALGLQPKAAPENPTG